MKGKLKPYISLCLSSSLLNLFGEKIKSGLTEFDTTEFPISGVDCTKANSVSRYGVIQKSCSKGILESCGLPGAKKIFAMEY